MQDAGGGSGKTLGLRAGSGREGAGHCGGGIAAQLLSPEPLPALTFGSASVVSTAAETSSISDPEEEETQAIGNQGKKAM